jgi:putative transposase
VGLVILSDRVGECSTFDRGGSRVRRAAAAPVLSSVGIDLGALPKKIRVDNGTEFTSKALDHWAYWNHVELDFSRPGKPADNAFIEAFNGTLRRECPSQHWFTDLDEVQGVLGHWRDDYNNHRPHSALGTRPPALYRAGEAETTDRSQLDGSGK